MPFMEFSIKCLFVVQPVQVFLEKIPKQLPITPLLIVQISPFSTKIESCKPEFNIDFRNRYLQFCKVLLPSNFP